MIPIKCISYYIIVYNKTKYTGNTPANKECYAPIAFVHLNTVVLIQICNSFNIVLTGNNQLLLLSLLLQIVEYNYMVCG